MTEETSDLELYDYKSGIYTIVALHFLSDLPICAQISCLGQMLAFAGDRCAKTTVTEGDLDKQARIDAALDKHRHTKKINSTLCKKNASFGW